MKIYACDCEYEEVVNSVQNSKLKGYTLIQKCAACIARDNQSALQDAKRKEIQDQKLFLVSTDYKVLRHRDQIDDGYIPTFSEAEYQDLLAARQAARNRINELEAQL